MLGLWPHAHLLDPFGDYDSSDADYGDGWDVMGGQRLDGSGRDCRFDSPSVEFNHTRSGPGLNSASLQKLGWIEPSRVTRHLTDGTEITVTLAPVNHPDASGALVAHVEPVYGPFAILTVELRWNDGWDRGIPRPAFLLHMVKEDGQSYLIPASASQHDWLPGMTYKIPGQLITIEFLNIDPTKRAGTFRIVGTLPYIKNIRDRFPKYLGPILERVFRVAWRIDRLVRQTLRILRPKASPRLERAPNPELCDLPQMLLRNRDPSLPADSPRGRRLR